MAEHCKECGKRLPILPIKDLCSDCEFDSKSSAGMSLKQGAEKPIKYCINCGSRMSEGAKLCTNCGKLVAAKVTDRRLSEDMLQTWSLALKKVGEVVDTILPIESSASNCMDCGVELTIDNSTGITPLCSSCGGKYVPEDLCSACGVPLTLSERTSRTQMCHNCWSQKQNEGSPLQQKAERIEIEQQAGMQRVHTITFHKDSEYANWLKRVGPNVEVLTTTTSKRGELDGSILNPWRHGILRHRSLVVTWKYRLPQPIPMVQQSPPLSQQQPKIDMAEQIEKLGRLRDQGLLTDEEFQTKKQELLSRL